ncbi:hypothetical protein GTO27_12735, partial [Candidatus Bathyarchaeota archaeon]|nr:hypothetical protein [Candidatus Bathyarchaeota archaeon]
MQKKTVSTLLLTLLLLGMSTLAFKTQPVRAEPRTWTVDDDGLADFSSIQEAIDSPLVTDGDTIFVHSGTYYENLVVNKAVSLIGEEKETTIIDGNEMGTVVLVTVSNLFIGGFTIQRSGEPNVGIAVVWSNNNTIDGNVIINNQFGIWLNFSDNNEVRGNVVANNIWDGIFLLDSNNNTVTTNTIFGCERGIRMEGSNHNVVKRNNVTDNHTGLAIGLGYNDTVTENTFSECLYGISLFKSGNDLIYHNNLINNQDQASTYRSYDNSWDDGYPSGGNYWSNYNGTDIDLDGIGDSRYIIDANNVDNHPLMGRFYSYCIPSDFGQGLGVTIVSNSTVSNFSVGKVVAIPIINSTSINSDGWKVTSGTRIIMFNISGETGLGFCRLCIPKALMAPPYTVAINRGPASPIYYNEKMFDNSTHRWIYFTYSHLTTHEVWIVGQKDTTPPVITLLSP